MNILKKFAVAGTGVAILAIIAAVAVNIVNDDEPSTSTAPMVVIPKIIDEVANITERPGGGLVCDHDYSMPVTLLPGIPTPLAHSTILLTITEDGAIITSDQAIEAESLVVGERLAAPLPEEMQNGTAHSMILPVDPIVEGGWGDVAYLDQSYYDLVLCRLDKTS
ncbi:MAG TPA: hypothetical protein VK497_04920 [Candidatus Saccharimonadales bacterium]|nr:hypothetical protein [Candidatus Saccharimonadales bacterium]